MNHLDKIIEELIVMGACKEAIDYLQKCSKLNKTWEDVWNSDCLIPEDLSKVTPMIYQWRLWLIQKMIGWSTYTKDSEVKTRLDALDASLKIYQKVYKGNHPLYLSLACCDIIRLYVSSYEVDPITVNNVKRENGYTVRNK